MIALACAAVIAAAPPPALRIALLGTSLTARGGWAEPLRVALGRRLGREVATIVVAEPGATTRWMLAALDRVAAARPAIVLVEGAANDAALHRPVSLDESRANMRRIVAGLRQRVAGVRIVMLGMNPAGGWRGWLRPRLDRLTDAHLADARGAGVETIDLRPRWAALTPVARRAAIPDGLHPAAWAATQTIIPPLVARLAAARPRSDGR